MPLSPLRLAEIVAGLLAGVVVVCNSVCVRRWIRAGCRGPGLPSPIVVIGGLCTIIAAGAQYFGGGSPWWFALAIPVEAEWLVPMVFIPKRTT